MGDALGAPVEFMNDQQISEIFGPEGVTELIIPPYLKHALITDDTQLMLFTCEGLIRSKTRAHRRNKERTEEGIAISLHRAYLRWLYTQGLQTQRWNAHDYDGWLLKIKRLYAYREPEVTCLTALGRGTRGTLENPINQSLGCGCVGRAIPIGLIEQGERAFQIGQISGALTHGEPTAYLSAGVVAYMVSCIVEGKTIKEATIKAIERVKKEVGHSLLSAKLEEAVRLGEEGTPTRVKLESLGEGFLAHEVLAMSVYVALCYNENYYEAIRFAVNQKGNSDSVAAIAGGLIGVSKGAEGLPEEKIGKIEMHREIQELAQDLITFYRPDEVWLEKYPAW